PIRTIPTNPTTTISRRTHQRVRRGWLVHIGFMIGRSALGKELGNFVGGNGAFANDAPALRFIAQIDNRGGDVPGRSAPVHDDVDTPLKLVAHLLRAGTL